MVPLHKLAPIGPTEPAPNTQFWAPIAISQMNRMITSGSLMRRNMQHIRAVDWQHDFLIS